MLAIRQPCDSAVAVRPAFVRCRCTIFPRQRASITAHAAPLGVAHPPTSDVLNWLVEQQDVQPSALQVDRVLMGERGWGLVATAPIAADAVILSVPLPAAITSEGAQDSAWSIHMAGQLLEQLKLGQAAVKRPWLDALPEHVPLPWLYWTSDQLEELQDADTIEEALRMHAVYEDACEVSSPHCWTFTLPGLTGLARSSPLHQLRCDPEPREESPSFIQFTPSIVTGAPRSPPLSQMFGGAFNEAQIAWALSLVHSRSFFERGTRVWVPGIDMCNHSLTPNAQVRTVHSPATCQGASASEEVAPPQPPEPSRFELVAGGAGLRWVMQKGMLAAVWDCPLQCKDKRKQDWQQHHCTSCIWVFTLSYILPCVTWCHFIGCRAGDEVTISYGSWPSDVFLLFFGWVDPAGNPNDAAVLFVDLLDLATFHQRCAAAQPSNTAQEAAQTAAAVAALMGVSSSMYAR